LTLTLEEVFRTIMPKFGVLYVSFWEKNAISKYAWLSTVLLRAFYFFKILSDTLRLQRIKKS